MAPRKRRPRRRHSKRTMVDFEMIFYRKDKLKMEILRRYESPEELKKIKDNLPLPKLLALAQIEDKEQETTEYLKSCSESEFVSACKMMVNLEEEINERQLMKFAQKGVEVTHHTGDIYRFPVKKPTRIGVAFENDVIERFELILSGQDKKSGNFAEGEIRGIDVYGNLHAKFLWNEEFVRKNCEDQLSTITYDVNFIINRTPYQRQRYALDFIEQHVLVPQLIRNPKFGVSLPFDSSKRHDFEIVDTLLPQLNGEQLMAVNNILTKPDKLPYVLFGPPGTGKTKTLVALIEQIVITTDKDVLVCAMSNSACDEITDRLLDVLDDDEIYRMYAKSYDPKKISSRIRQIANVKNNEVFFPSLEFLYQFRVLVCTMCTAGCLTRARIDPLWNAKHFGYVIVDECASSHLTMTMIPVAGLCTSTSTVHANVVLAGDPKQLSPVTTSRNAKTMGFQKSWLEYLCDMKLYQRDPTTGRLNGNYITQLVKNYRSHPAILKKPSELFYESKLEPLARNVNSYIGSDILPSKQFPIIFKSVQGECKRSKRQPSSFNEAEFYEVINFIEKLLSPKSTDMPQIVPSDIGVISMYKRQCEEISEELKSKGLKDIFVETAEAFQGQERPVMIVSTVRSGGKHLGFVDDDRRFNFVITRAKCLLIVVGDPHTLQLNSSWMHFMEYCNDNNGFIQSSKSFTFPSQEDE